MAMPIAWPLFLAPWRFTPSAWIVFGFCPAVQYWGNRLMRTLFLLSNGSARVRLAQVRNGFLVCLYHMLPATPISSVEWLMFDFCCTSPSKSPAGFSPLSHVVPCTCALGFVLRRGHTSHPRQEIGWNRVRQPHTPLTDTEKLEALTVRRCILHLEKPMVRHAWRYTFRAVSVSLDRCTWCRLSLLLLGETGSRREIARTVPRNNTIGRRFLLKLEGHRCCWLVGSNCCCYPKENRFLLLFRRIRRVHHRLWKSDRCVCKQNHAPSLP